MAKARALDKRRKSIRNIRKITRTMELIATARFKKAMDRAHAATAYTRRITQLVADLANSGLEVSHPLLEGAREDRAGRCCWCSRPTAGCAAATTGTCSGPAFARLAELQGHGAGGAAGDVRQAGHRGCQVPQPVGRPRPTRTSRTSRSFDEVEVLANRYLEDYAAGKLDRLDVAYMRFENVSRQCRGRRNAAAAWASCRRPARRRRQRRSRSTSFCPSAESILEEVVPTSFKVKLFKCFLDAAVSEQVARMVAMKAATENAGDRIKQLSMQYNRARQSQITGEIMEIIGGVEALKN